MAADSAPAKGQPFSIRLSHATERFVAEEARRLKRSRSAVVEALTEEAVRMRRFPGIGFRGPDYDRRAWVIGTGLDVWQVAEALDEAGGEELDPRFGVGPVQVALAVAYRRHFADEIATAMRLNRRPVAEVLEQFPFLRHQALG